MKIFILCGFLLFACDKNVTDGRLVDTDETEIPSFDDWQAFNGVIYFSESLFSAESSIYKINYHMRDIRALIFANSDYMPDLSNQTVYFSSKNRLKNFSIYTRDKSISSYDLLFYSQSDLLYPRVRNQRCAFYDKSNNAICLLNIDTRILEKSISMPRLLYRNLAWKSDSVLIVNLENSGFLSVEELNIYSEALTFVGKGFDADWHSGIERFIYVRNDSLFNRQNAETTENFIIRLDQASYPRFSPDGTEMVLTSTAMGKKLISIVNLDGSNLRRMHIEGVDAAYYSWRND